MWQQMSTLEKRTIPPSRLRRATLYTRGALVLPNEKHPRFLPNRGLLVSLCLFFAFIRVFNKTLKSVLLGRRNAASGHCR